LPKNISRPAEKEWRRQHDSKFIVSLRIHWFAGSGRTVRLANSEGSRSPRDIPAISSGSRAQTMGAIVDLGRVPRTMTFAQ
jgi:hypothetical protein